MYTLANNFQVNEKIYLLLWFPVAYKMKSVLLTIAYQSVFLLTNTSQYVCPTPDIQNTLNPP